MPLTLSRSAGSSEQAVTRQMFRGHDLVLDHGIPGA